MDLESFKILVAKDPVNDRFTFEGIYIYENGMNSDSIHGDKTPPPAPKHPIMYYFLDGKHPVVFVNTRTMPWLSMTRTAGFGNGSISHG